MAKQVFIVVWDDDDIVETRLHTETEDIQAIVGACIQEGDYFLF